MRAALEGGGGRNQGSRPWLAVSEPWHNAVTATH